LAGVVLTKKNYIKKAVRLRICQQAQDRCGYCLTPQDFVTSRLPIEHIIPTSREGPSIEENLWLSCSSCNSHKGNKTHARDPLTGQTVKLFNPRKQIWREHFAWIQNGLRIAGMTPIGRATVVALKLNNPLSIKARRIWITTGQFPPRNS